MKKINISLCIVAFAFISACAPLTEAELAEWKIANDIERQSLDYQAISRIDKAISVRVNTLLWRNHNTGGSTLVIGTPKDKVPTVKVFGQDADVISKWLPIPNGNQTVYQPADERLDIVSANVGTNMKKILEKQNITSQQVNTDLFNEEQRADEVTIYITVNEYSTSYDAGESIDANYIIEGLGKDRFEKKYSVLGNIFTGGCRSRQFSG